MHVLIHRNVLHIVVAIGAGWIRVGKRKQIKNATTVWVDEIRRNAAVHKIGRCRADIAVAEVRVGRGITEVPFAHGLSRHPRLQRSRIEPLSIKLVSGEEKHTVSVLVEVRAWNKKWAADIETRVVELVFGFV